METHSPDRGMRFFVYLIRIVFRLILKTTPAIEYKTGQQLALTSYSLRFIIVKMIQEALI